MIDNEHSTDPPVPPRRTKRKNKSASIASSVARSDATEVTSDDARSRLQKRPLQPALPEKCQWDESRSAVEIRQPQCDIAASYSRSESVNERVACREGCNAVVVANIIETKSPRSRDDAIFAREVPPKNDKANDDPVPAKSAALKPPLLPFPDTASPKQRTFDKYPPLFFTLHDFEDVMSATWEDGSKGAPSATLDEKSSIAQILDDEDDIYFRVTTTNFPFEKCLDKWGGFFDNDEFAGKLDDYRFDNNKNQSGRTKVNRLSSCDSFDHDYRIGTKVRFVIDSPPSKHNDNVKIDATCDNLQSCASIFGDGKASGQSVASFVKLTEIQEEFADVKDCGDNLRDKLCASDAEKRNTTMREDDPFVLTEANKVDVKLKTIPQMHYDDINDEKFRKEDSNFISWDEHVSDENHRIGNENITTTITKEIIMKDECATIQIDQSEMSDASSEIAESVCRFTDKSFEAVCSNEEANAAKITLKNKHREEEISLKNTNDNIEETRVVENERISVNESLSSFLDDDKPSFFTNHFTNESLRIEETRLSTEKYKDNNDFVDSKYNRDETLPSKKIFTKSVPVKIRRDSFLETMLSDDSTDTSVNYAIATKTVTSSSIDKELIPNESANNIRESDVAKRSEHLRDFDNKTTRCVDTEKDLKKTKEIVKVSSTDVKSIQSENKNACDVKSDVLNELLCNFSNIKLKILSPENKNPAMQILDSDKNIASSITMDNEMSKEKGRAASKSLEKSENEVCDTFISAKITDVNNDMAIVEKMAREDFTEINIEKKRRDPENSACNSAMDEKIAKSKNIKVTESESCYITDKTARDHSIRESVDENIWSVKPKESRAKTKMEETFEGAESTDRVKREPKQLRDIRVPKTILKKQRSSEYEQQQMNTCEKRIPIGAPATMIKIFDSRELESVAVASRSPEAEEEQHEMTWKQMTHSRGKEKTDEVIAVSEADDDRGGVANQSTLALLDDTMGSDDKCAIARKTTSVIPCNNNDNNRAVTPVANVSNDQSSRDVVTITPGKVRSFVKYYEIRGDVTTVERRNSKIKDREKVNKCKSTKKQAPPVAARNSQPEVMTEGEETKGRSVESNDTLETSSSNKIQNSIFATKIPKDSAQGSSHETAMAESRVTKGRERNESHVIDEEARAPLAKTPGAKKTVQFLGGFTVIHSGSFDEDDSTGIVTDCDANASRKRRGDPGIPSSPDSDARPELIHELENSEKVPERGSFQRREAVAQIHAVTSHGENSGFAMNRLANRPPVLLDPKWFNCTARSSYSVNEFRRFMEEENSFYSASHLFGL